jgi:4-amino-4-deoxychorismate lyase
MFPLIETIKISDGVPQNLQWHQRRLENSFRKYYHKTIPFEIAETLVVPGQCTTGLVKARLVYSDKEYQWFFETYHKSKIKSLKLIHDDKIEYELKYNDRVAINNLFAQRKNCDDVLIVKKGQVADTSYCNIVFYDGEKWITPLNPLLKGTCRDRLLHEKKITEKIITPDQINQFKSFKLINAMREFEEVEEVSVSSIFK